MLPSDLPAAPGTYALIFTLPDPLIITAGSRGEVALPPGHLIYVGSAFGPGGLHARVARHLRADKRPHWHIDALTTVSQPVGVWYVDSSTRLECAWSAALAAIPGVDRIPGFGASDCRCHTHLYALPTPLLDSAYWALFAAFFEAADL